MKKNIWAILMIVAIFVPTIANAFGSAEDERIPVTAAETSVAEPTVQSHKTRKVVIVPNTESMIKRGMQNATKVIETKVGIKIGKAFINFEERQIARDKQRDEQFAKKDTETAKAVTALRNDLVDPQKGALPNLKSDINSTIVFTAICLGGVVLVVGGILAFSIRCSRNQVVAAVDDVNVKVDSVPEETAKRIKTLVPTTVTLENVLGHTVKYTASVVDGAMYQTLHVPKDIAPVMDVSKIVRTTCTSVGKLCSSARSSMVEYFTRLEKVDINSLTDESDKQKKVLIEKLIKDGIIVVA